MTHRKRYTYSHKTGPIMIHLYDDEEEGFICGFEPKESFRLHNYIPPQDPKTFWCKFCKEHQYKVRVTAWRDMTEEEKQHGA